MLKRNTVTSSIAFNQKIFYEMNYSLYMESKYLKKITC